MTTQPPVRSRAHRCTRRLGQRISRRVASPPARRRRVCLAVLLTLVAPSCTSDGSTTADPASALADYRAELAAICELTRSVRVELTDPVDAATTTSFADSVSRALTTEADSARALRPPSDLDADHRAFVQNTDDQARAWSRLATTPIDDAAAFGAVQNEILELTLGRDDLTIDMGVESCRVAPPESS